MAAKAKDKLAKIEFPFVPVDKAPEVLEFLEEHGESSMETLYRSLLGEDAADYIHQNALRVTLGLLRVRGQAYNPRRGYWIAGKEPDPEPIPLPQPLVLAVGEEDVEMIDQGYPL